jgi:hypothetical protein
MDMIGQLKGIIGLCDSLHNLYNEYKDIDDKYASIIHDIIILKNFVLNIESNPRISDDISQCLDLIKLKLSELLKHLTKYNKENKICSLLHGRHREIIKLERKINNQIKKLELLYKLSKDISNNARLDIANIISDKKAVEFWDYHFGKDVLEVSFSIFIEAFESNINRLIKIDKNINVNTNYKLQCDTYNIFTVTDILPSNHEVSIDCESNNDFRRIKPQEMNVLKNILDSNNDGSVSAYEFNKWLERFGNFNNIVTRTLTSLMNTKTGEIHIWFKKDNYKRQSIKYLKKNNIFGEALIRYHDYLGYFVLDFTGITELPSIDEPSKINIEIYELIIKLKENNFILLKPPNPNNFIKLLFRNLDNERISYDYLSQIVKDVKNSLRRIQNMYCIMNNETRRRSIYNERIHCNNKSKYNELKITPDSSSHTTWSDNEDDLPPSSIESKLIKE